MEKNPKNKPHFLYYFFILLFLDAAIIFSLLYSFFPFIFFFFQLLSVVRPPFPLSKQCNVLYVTKSLLIFQLLFLKIKQIKKKKTANKTKKQWSYNSCQDLPQSLIISLFYLKTYFLNHLFYKHLVFNRKCPEHAFLKIIISIPFTPSLEIAMHTMVHYLPLRNNITKCLNQHIDYLTVSVGRSWYGSSA